MACGPQQSLVTPPATTAVATGAAGGGTASCSWACWSPIIVSSRSEPILSTHCIDSSQCNLAPAEGSTARRCTVWTLCHPPELPPFVLFVSAPCCGHARRHDRTHCPTP